jgi:hypothetical protein
MKTKKRSYETIPVTLFTREPGKPDRYWTKFNAPKEFMNHLAQVAKVTHLRIDDVFSVVLAEKLIRDGCRV